MLTNKQRLLVVSNRLPVVLKPDGNGGLASSAGGGGLVSALAPVMRERGGTWIGWPGSPDLPVSATRARLNAESRRLGIDFGAVDLSCAEVAGYYGGFSNRVIWPLFHDLPDAEHHDDADWHTYRQVNLKFAQAAAARAEPSDLLWVHDYQLLRVGHYLRRLGLSNRLGFYLHIPFPSPEVLMRLPQRQELLRGLLEYDLVGLQTRLDCRNLIGCLSRFFEVTVSGDGPVMELLVRWGDGQGRRMLRVGHFPISIDYQAFARRAAGPRSLKLSSGLRRLARGRRILYSVDRLDYTKGIVTKLRAFRSAVRSRPELVEQAVLFLQVVPSREDIPEYRFLRREIDRLVTEINEEFGLPGKSAVHYWYRNLPPEELVAHYQAADVMLVTPYRDGMNLVAKEYCACQRRNDGVLVLSEFAGAAAELGSGALLVDPHDERSVAGAIEQALAMDVSERVERMRSLGRTIRQHDVYRWVDSYMQGLAGPDMQIFPRTDADHRAGVVSLTHASNL